MVKFLDDPNWIAEFATETFQLRGVNIWDLLMHLMINGKLRSSNAFRT